jgi:hypothetical protein
MHVMNCLGGEANRMSIASASRLSSVKLATVAALAMLASVVVLLAMKRGPVVINTVRHR